VTTLLRPTLLGLSLALLAALPPAHGQDKSVRPGINKPFENPNVKEYVGKFEVESREVYARRQEIVAACRLQAGMAVADIGAGTGLFTRLFARAVGPRGKVYAVDIAPAFVAHVEKTCKDQGLTNVAGIVCKQDSVELPPGSIDLAFICDTYHHFEFPARTLQSIHRALRPSGQMVLIDFHRIKGKSDIWILLHVRAGQEVFTREITSAGFEVVGEEKLLKDNYLVRFRKVDAGGDGTRGPVRSFVYTKTPQADLEMIVHFPPGWKAGDRRPGIVFFFGGGWERGTVQQFERQAAYLAGRGLVAARADYRVKSRHGVTPKEGVEDARSAVRWLRQNAGMLGLDPDRLVAAGGSAGGHLAACTALGPGPEPGEKADVSARPSALVLFNPVLHFVPELLPRLGNDAALGRALSPTLHLAKGSPPTLLFYGTADRLLKQGEEFMGHAKELGHRAELYTAQGQGHGFFNRSPWQEKTLRRTDEFLVSLGYLTGPPTIEVPDAPAGKPRP
jgi:acetyl esterase/lipase